MYLLVCLSSGTATSKCQAWRCPNPWKTSSRAVPQDPPWWVHVSCLLWGWVRSPKNADPRTHVYLCMNDIQCLCMLMYVCILHVSRPKCRNCTISYILDYTSILCIHIYCIYVYMRIIWHRISCRLPYALRIRQALTMHSARQLRLMFLMQAGAFGVLQRLHCWWCNCWKSSFPALKTNLAPSGLG